MCEANMDRELLMNLLQDLKAYRKYLDVRVARLRGEPVDIDVSKPLGFSATKSFNSFILRSCLQLPEQPKKRDVKYFEDRLALTEKLIRDLLNYVLEVA